MTSDETYCLVTWSWHDWSGPNTPFVFFVPQWQFGTLHSGRNLPLFLPFFHFSPSTYSSNPICPGTCSPHHLEAGKEAVSRGDNMDSMDYELAACMTDRIVLSP